MVKDFLKHLFPRVVVEKNLRITYTFCLGGIAFTTYLILLVSGVMLMVYYQPVPERAYSSILFLESAVPGGKFLRSLHRLGSHSFLVLLALHTLRVILTGAWQRPRHLNWVIGCLLLFLSVFAGYTGCLLPYDQFAFWAARTGMEFLEAAPLGHELRLLLAPDGPDNSLSLLRFYCLHVALIPGGLLLLSFIHFYRVRKNKGVLPYL